ncbi:g11571 [Coccomyxa elongata]
MKSVVGLSADAARTSRPFTTHKAFSRPFARSQRSQSVTCQAGSHDIVAHDHGIRRRQLLHFAAAASMGTFWPLTASAESSDARQALLDAIAAKKGDDEVIAALRKLAKQNPTSSPAKSPTIYGKWKLLWASSNAEVSRVLKLPIPAKSTQLLGKEFVGDEGRGANLIDIGNGTIVVRLSSAAVPDEKDDTTVLIGPPFYLEAKVAGFNIPIQDTQPGGGRKSILGNEINYFRQLYVENSGKPGDLRVSEVYAGDPAVKGSIFVHERM